MRRYGAFSLGRSTEVPIDRAEAEQTVEKKDECDRAEDCFRELLDIPEFMKKSEYDCPARSNNSVANSHIFYHDLFSFLFVRRADHVRQHDEKFIG
jgi:hypothetical protein